MSPKHITIETSGTVFSLPHYTAKELGFFAEEGLEVRFVRRQDHQNPSDVELIEDHHDVTSFGGVSPFESGETALYRACEWGQVRRTYDTQVGGKLASKRAASASQAIIVRPDSPVNVPQDLAGIPIGVNYHHGSHYVAIQLLEGFLRPEEIEVVHIEGKNRFEALRDGLVNAVAVMEPWITVAEKLGYKVIAEAHYVGLEIASPDLDDDTFEAIDRAVRRAVAVLQEDPYPYVKYLIADVPSDIVELEPTDFKRTRLRYNDPAPYPKEQFQRSYDWMVRWGLIGADSGFDDLVANRITVPA